MNVHKLFIGLVLAILLLPATTLAGKKKDFAWEAITQSDWNVSEDTAKNMTDAVMIFEKIITNDKKYIDDKCYRTIYRRIRILSDEGRSWGDVAVPSHQTNQKIEDIRGRTVLRDGSEILLTSENIFEKKAIKSKKLTIKQTSFSIPGVTDDCIVEYMIKIRTKNYVPTWIIQKDIALLHGELRWVMAVWEMSRLQADIYEDYITPNYLWLNTTTNTKTYELPNIKAPETLLFVIDSLPAYESEPYTIPKAALKTKLITYYGSKGRPESFWDEQSINRNKRMEKFCRKDKRVVTIVKSFDYLETEDEKIAAAYSWIQDNITNLAYFDVYDRKEPEKKIKPKKRKNVNDVIKRGYAGRRQINYLFCDMLREMNIDAKITFVRSRYKDLFTESAKYWQFNQSLVGIESDNSPIVFYAPGFPYVAIGEVPWLYQGAMALVAGSYKVIAAIPFSDPSETSITRVFDYTIDEDLEIEGQVSERNTGCAAQSLRKTTIGEEAIDLADLLTKEIEDNYSNRDIDLSEYKNLDDPNKPVVLLYGITQPDLSVIGDRILLKPFNYFSDSDNPFGSEKRREAIMFAYSYKLRESAQITIPDGWIIEGLPSDTTFENEVGQCTVTFQDFGGSLSVQRLFVLNNPFWLVEQYPSLYALYQARQEMSDLIVTLSNSETIPATTNSQ